MPRPLSPGASRLRRHVACLVSYAALYIAYLFARPESELWHWLTLVLLPAALVLWRERRSASALLRSVGLTTARARRGWPLTLVLAVAFQVLQLLNREQGEALRGLLATPRGALCVPLAFVLLLGTAATTEEFFFRGLLQRRLAAAWRSDLAAVAIVTVLFTLYHVPYAYLRWPSAGNLPAALGAATASGLVAGLPIALVFWRSRGNLAAAIVLHACIDLVPATRLVAHYLT